MVFGPRVFVGGVGQTTHLYEKNGLFAVPPKAARPKTTLFIKMCGLFDLDAPSLQKLTWPKKHIGVPLTSPTTR